MTASDSRVTVHMAVSLDGCIARKNSGVDWMDTSDEFAEGETLKPGVVESFLRAIDCDVMGSRTCETALGFQMAWVRTDR